MLQRICGSFNSLGSRIQILSFWILRISDPGNLKRIRFTDPYRGSKTIRILFFTHSAHSCSETRRCHCGATCIYNPIFFGSCRFEISSGDGLVFVGSSPDECHKKLLSLLNMNYPAKIVNDNINCGADFFGLTNATVHYLVLSLPGVSKCAKYSFKKFSVSIAVSVVAKNRNCSSGSYLSEYAQVMELFNQNFQGVAVLGRCRLTPKKCRINLVFSDFRRKPP